MNDDLEEVPLTPEEQSDIADLAIEDLRKWSRWEVAERILALSGKKSHDIPIVRRSILRYALSCPNQKAMAFVEEQRKRFGDIDNYPRRLSDKLQKLRDDLVARFRADDSGWQSILKLPERTTL